MPFENDREDIIEGRNAVMEALRAGVSMDKIYKYMEIHIYIYSFLDPFPLQVTAKY